MEIPCIIKKTVYRKDNFAILAVELNAFSGKYSITLEDIVEKKLGKRDRDGFIVTTNILKPEDVKVEGRQCIFIGDFTTNAKYGVQFQSEFHYLDMPVNQAGLQAYLMTITNIKEARSKDIIKKFGVAGTLDVLDNHPEKLLQINGITEVRLATIKEAWDREKSKRKLYVWFGEVGVPITLGSKIYDIWGDNSQKALTENPYKLTEIKGFSFSTADKIAYKVMKDVPLDYRIKSCLEHIITEDMYANGNLCMLYPELKDRAIGLMKECDIANGSSEVGGKLNYSHQLPIVIKANLDTFVPVKNLISEEAFIYLKDIWMKEDYVAKQIYNRHIGSSKRKCTDSDVDEAEEDLSIKYGKKIQLDNYQREAIKSAFNHKITVITGRGGSGKSTICRCIYYLAKQKALSVNMMSPTGKAAQILTEKTGGQAKTIHRALKIKPDEDIPRDEVQEDIVIIDEISMVGLDTIYPLLLSAENNIWGNFVFVGDPNQLPSVSPGSFLSDIMKSGCVNVVSLEQIHRQDDKSYVPILADAMSKGQHMPIPIDAHDLKWIELNENNDFEPIIRAQIETLLEHNELDDIQFISPKKEGFHGVYKINHIMQKLVAERNGYYDKPQCHIRRDLRTFYVGDRIIQTQNNYDKQIFNGDMGTIIDLGRKILDPLKSEELVDYVIVKFFGSEIMFMGKEIDKINLAWCCTVHKFQGSQSPIVIFVMSKEARFMMKKELVYTAFTRCSKKLIVYGNSDMYKLAPRESIIKNRLTNMNNIIAENNTNTKILKVMQ